MEQTGDKESGQRELASQPLKRRRTQCVDAEKARREASREWKDAERRREQRERSVAGRRNQASWAMKKQKDSYEKRNQEEQARREQGTAESQYQG